MTQNVWTGSAQRAGGTDNISLHLIQYHKQIFPGLKVLCRTEAAEASFSPVANFLDEAQGAGVCELPSEVWLLGHPARPSGDPGPQFPCPPWDRHSDLGTISLWGRQGAAGPCRSLWAVLQGWDTQCHVSCVCRSHLCWLLTHRCLRSRRSCASEGSLSVQPTAVCLMSSWESTVLSGCVEKLEAFWSWN